MVLGSRFPTSIVIPWKGNAPEVLTFTDCVPYTAAVSVVVTEPAVFGLMK